MLNPSTGGYGSYGTTGTSTEATPSGADYTQPLTEKGTDNWLDSQKFDYGGGYTPGSQQKEKLLIANEYFDPNNIQLKGDPALISQRLIERYDSIVERVGEDGFEELMDAVGNMQKPTVEVQEEPTDDDKVNLTMNMFAQRGYTPKQALEELVSQRNRYIKDMDVAAYEKLRKILISQQVEEEE